MKITKKNLEILIKEEIEKIITEQDDGGFLEPELVKIIEDYQAFLEKLKSKIAAVEAVNKFHQGFKMTLAQLESLKPTTSQKLYGALRALKVAENKDREDAKKASGN